MSSFCPYCDADITKAIRQTWEYQTYFIFYCPKCGKKIEIEVEAIPNFVVIEP